MADHIGDSRLVTVLQLVNDWLKYAELKNAALLTLNGALIIGMHRLYEWQTAPSSWIGWLLAMATVLLVLSLFLGLASFYAFTKTFGFDLARRTNPAATNALYFGHLAEMTRDDVLKRLVDGYAPDKPDRYLEDMAEQIIINAKIARRKFALFNGALFVTIAALLTLPLAVLFFWRICDERL